MAKAQDQKLWGSKPFWGLGSEFDLDWFLTPSQKQLQMELMELCRTKIRPRAAHYDSTYTFPRDSIDDLAEMGLLGLLVPKELGGRGENHICMAMVIETIARYGCPSTAMVYTMHIVGILPIMMVYHGNPLLEDLLRNIDKKKLLGTSLFSDPSTGGHFWFALSSKSKFLDEENVKLLRYGAWCTSAGYADWYVINAASPNSSGDYSKSTLYFATKENARTYADEWKALGMRGNYSSSVVFDTVLKKSHIVGEIGGAMRLVAELLIPIGGSLFAASFNGIAMAALDIAKRHVTTKSHADVGLRICDYTSIQDSFGDNIVNVMCSRMILFTHMQHLDQVTDNCDWSRHRDPSFCPRTPLGMYLYITKYFAGQMSAEVTDNMLRACGGEGFRQELGIERLLRDSRAGWLMAPSNEVSKQILGKLCLFGPQGVDLWEHLPNNPLLQREVKKLSKAEKQKLAKQLLKELELSENEETSNSEESFDHPFNTMPAQHIKQYVTSDGLPHDSALNPHNYTSLTLLTKEECAPQTLKLQFAFPCSSDHLGTLPGQYIQMRVASKDKGESQERYFSPISKPNQFGILEILTRLEDQGLVSQAFHSMKQGDKVDFRGPSGGFEYKPKTLSHLVLIGSGVGATPALQLIRCIATETQDSTLVTFIFCANKEDDLLLRKEVDQYAENGRINVTYILRNPECDWNGEEGELDLDKMESLLPTPNQSKEKVLICGGPTFVTSCLQSLRWLEWPSDNIFIYGHFGTEYIRKVYGRNAPLGSHRSQD